MQLNGTKVELWIDKETAIVNGSNKMLDVPPTIINQRTMLPLRFVAENLGSKLDWDGATQTITLSYGGTVNRSNDTPTKWYEKEYTHQISSTFGTYIDGGIGFSISYPLAWGKPKVTESEKYGFRTYTTFYESKNVKIISYGNKVNGTYQDYLKEYQKLLTRNNYTPTATEISVKNAEKAYLIDLEPGMTNTISYIAFKNGEACHIEVTISEVGLSDELDKVLDLLQKMMQTFELNAAVG
nr:copper amine oxidase N-terminal domain-containing protein [Paenibacillus sp. GP183]